ncbi:MAG: RimK/LysX family protein [Paracoccaceae bacterium]
MDSPGDPRDASAPQPDFGTARIDTPHTPRPHALRAPLVIGWRECVGLPDLGIAAVEAKIDTGARTSALHAEDIEEYWQDGLHMARFHVPHGDKLHVSDCTARLVDRREVKNTSGEPAERMVIETTLLLNRRRWKIEVTLADRTNMTLPLILGRTALRRHRVLVDPGKSHLIRRLNGSQGRNA